MKRTAAVIVTYNRKAMLQRCLRALCTQTAGVPELWVIDNASTDGTAELVAQLNLPTMHYYNTGKNLGGAGGFACGIQQAACSGAEYLWIMDDDCLPEPDALQQLLLAEKYEVRLTDFERQNRQLLHAKTGAAIARTLFGECEAVCSAITYHTTGKTDMTTLEKIIYLADMIEPNRTYPGVDTIRAAAEENLDGGVLLALERTICYLQEEGFAVCEDSVRARDFLLRERNLTQHEA